MKLFMAKCKLYHVLLCFIIWSQSLLAQNSEIKITLLNENETKSEDAPSISNLQELQLGFCSKEQNPFVVYQATPSDWIRNGKIHFLVCVSMNITNNHDLTVTLDDVRRQSILVRNAVLSVRLDNDLIRGFHVDRVWPLGSILVDGSTVIEVQVDIDLSRLGVRLALAGGSLVVAQVIYQGESDLGPFEQTVGAYLSLASCVENPNGFFNVENREFGCPESLDDFLVKLDDCEVHNADNMDALNRQLISGDVDSSLYENAKAALLEECMSM